MQQTNPPFVYKTSFDFGLEPVCGICDQIVSAALFIFGLTTLDAERSCAYICDGCLLKMLAVIPASVAESRQTIGDLVAMFKQNPGRLSE